MSALVACLTACLATWPVPARPAAVARGADAAGAVLLVTVTGVGSAMGHVRVAVCGRADFLRPHCAQVASAPARRGDVTLRIENIPPGTYAVQAWHDANDNGRIDRNLLGLPTEALGFSRDARMWFGPPRFDDAAIRLAPGPNQTRFALHGY